MEYIPESILEFAKYISPSLTPKKRASGWAELESENRGNGDLMDLLGSLFIFDKISKAGKVCKMDITCGTGDKADIEVRVNNEFKRTNIKTSSYTPYRDGLNLYVKEEEIDKDISAYVQVFVHLKELQEDDEAIYPHVHIGGWIPTSSDVWLSRKKNIITIPNTGGHRGVKIPLEYLQPIDKMIGLIDDKF